MSPLSGLFMPQRWRSLLVRQEAGQDSPSSLTGTDASFPVIAPARLLESERDLFAGIRSSAVVRAADFDRLIAPLLLNVAAYLHALPASADFHHVEPRGLLRHSLEVAYYAHRLSKGRIFTDGHNPEHRNSREPRWRVAAFLVGLLHDLAALTRIEVGDEAGMACWDPMRHSLVEWASRHSIRNYQVSWRPPDTLSQDATPILALIDRIVPCDLAAQLQTPDPAIDTALRRLLTRNDSASTSVLGDLVAQANAHSVDRYLGGADGLLGTPRKAVPPKQRVLLAMRRLLRREWGVNRRGGTAYVAPEGVFLAWRTASRDLINALGNDAVDFPRTADGFADFLIELGMAQTRASGDGTTSRYWRVRSRLGLRPTSPMNCLLVPRAEWLFDHVAVAHITVDILDAPTDEVPKLGTEAAPIVTHADSLSQDEAHQAVSRPTASEPPEPASEDATGGVLPAGTPLSPDRANEELNRLHIWASDHGAAGAFLACVAEDLAEQRLVCGEDYELLELHFAYRTPHLPKRHGFDPEVLIAALDEAGWVEIDPIQPMVKIRVVAQDPMQQFVVLCRGISARLLRLLKPRRNGSPGVERAMPLHLRGEPE